MNVQELIEKLQETEDKERDVSIVIGNEDYNSIVFDKFELHNIDNWETSIELFCFDNYMIKEGIINN
jgi:hypothetical protein